MHATHGQIFENIKVQFRSLRTKGAWAAFALTALACLGAGMPAAAATYYVSPTGSDSNNGTSTSTPWQTITKVNSAHFVAGDSILFQGGQTFTGALVFSYATNIPASSTTTPITVGSYGTGAAEILSNNTGTSSAAITVNGINGLTINGLTILGGGGTSPLTWIGVYILNASGSSKSGVTVNNCDISNFAGTNGSQSAEVYVSGFYGALDTINITNNQLHGANGVGSKDSNGIYGIGNGENITNVTYSGNTVYNLGGLAGNVGGGIVANGVNGGLLQYNLVHDVGGNSTSCGGPAGIWAYTSNNITIQYNEVYRVQPITYTTGCDWDAYDLDGGVSNSVVQYNYSHNNFGAALLAYDANAGGHTWGNNIYRYNLSENDALGAGGANQMAIYLSGSPANPIQIYGNTIYMGLKNSTGLSNAIGSNNGVAITLPAGSIIENNIFDIVPQLYFGHTYTQYMYFPYGLSGGTINNNIYYGGATFSQWLVGTSTYTTLAAYQTGTGYESLSQVADPLLANPGGGGTLSWTPSLHNGPQPNPAAYWLSSGSPAINAGATVSGATRDYYGNTVPGAGGYNIGASQGTGSGTTGPAGYWALDEGTGTTTSDFSGHGNNGTLTNSPTWIAGKLGNALTFNGTSSYVNLNNATTSGVLKPTLPVTISAWIKLTSNSGSQIVFTSDEWDAGKYAGCNLSINAGVLGCAYGNAAGGNSSGFRQSKSGTTVLAINTWYHVAAVIQSAANMSLYINGVDDGGTYSGTGSTLGYTTATSKIGTGGSSQYFNGTIDDVRFFNRVLSSTEIELLAMPPVSEWLMDEGTGTLTQDAGTAGIDGTLINTPTWATGFFDYALSFNSASFQAVNMNNTSASGPLKPALPVTITAWIKLNNTGGIQRIFSSDNSDNSSVIAGYDIGIVSGVLECDYGDGAGAGTTHRRSKSGTTALTTGKWYFVAAVIQGATNMTLYVNGVNENGSYSGTGGTMAYTTTPSKIATSNTVNYFNGVIDDVRVYNTALSAAQISALAATAPGTIPPE